MGCAMLLIYYKTSHPWRELGLEREGHCCGKLGDRGVPLRCERPYWEEEKEGEFSHHVGVFQLHSSILETFKMQPLTEEEKSRNDSTVTADEGLAEANADSTQESYSTIQQSISPPSGLSSNKSYYSRSWWSEDENECRLQKFTEIAFE